MPRLDTRSMNWIPHRHTQLASLDAGLRKALAMQPVISGECA